MGAREIGYLIHNRVKNVNNIQLDELQLQKLVYISFGYYAIFNDNKDLYQDKIEAWQYGPVIPNLYNKGKSKPKLESNKSVLSIVDFIVARYGYRSGLELVRFTHSKGTPWHKVYEEGKRNIEIPKNIIKEHYNTYYRPMIDTIKFFVNSGLYNDLAKM